VVDAPGWSSAQLHGRFTERLVSPLRLENDGPSIYLRIDTDGSLICWDALLSNTW
jgi:hypothetical protein